MVVSVVDESKVAESVGSGPLGDDETDEVTEPTLVTVLASLAPPEVPVVPVRGCAIATCEATTSAAKTEMCVIFIEINGKAFASPKRPQFVSNGVPLQGQSVKRGLSGVFPSKHWLPCSVVSVSFIGTKEAISCATLSSPENHENGYR